jgi:hypothetical protein
VPAGVWHALKATGTFGGILFGSAPTAGPVFLALTVVPSTDSPSFPFGSLSAGGLGTGQLIGGLFGTASVPLPQTSLSFGKSLRDRPGFGKASIEEYSLIETSYPSTKLGGVLLKDWFLNGNDSLEISNIKEEHSAVSARKMFSFPSHF